MMSFEDACKVGTVQKRPLLSIGVNDLGAGGWQVTLQYFFYQRVVVFLAAESKRGK
jgi:hypothetical protein